MNYLETRIGKISLLIGGLALLIAGITIAILGGNEVPPVELSKYKISPDPILISEPFTWYDYDFKPDKEGSYTNLKKIDVVFTASDVFAANEKIDVTVKLQVRDPPNTERVMIYFPSFQASIPDPTYDGLLRVFGESKNILIFSKNQTDGIFYASGTIEPHHQQKLSFFMVIQLSNGGEESIRSPSTLIDVQPYYVKLQTVLSRVNIEQIEQENKAIQAQNKNNAIITGLTLVILGWLPLEVLINQRR